MNKCQDLEVEDMTTGKCMNEAGIKLKINNYLRTEYKNIDYSTKSYFLTYCYTPLRAMDQLKDVYFDHCPTERGEIMREKDEI